MVEPKCPKYYKDRLKLFCRTFNFTYFRTLLLRCISKLQILEARKKIPFSTTCFTAFHGVLKMLAKCKDVIDNLPELNNNDTKNTYLKIYHKMAGHDVSQMSAS